MESTHQYKKKASFSPNQDLFQLIQIPTQRKEQGQPNSDLKVKEISVWSYRIRYGKRKKYPEFGMEEKLIWVTNYGKKLQTLARKSRHHDRGRKFGM